MARPGSLHALIPVNRARDGSSSLRIFPACPHYYYEVQPRFLLLAALTIILPAAAEAETVVLQIHILEGEGSVFAASSRALRPLTVRVTDETGAPLERVAVSFRLPEDGVSGTFQNGLKTDLVLSGADGKAASPNIVWGPMAGPVRVRVTAARDEARAGVLVPVYVSALPGSGEPGGAGSAHSSGVVAAGASIAPQAAPIRVVDAAAPKLKSKKGWVRLVGIAAAGGAAGGLALAKAHSRSSRPGVASAAPLPPVSVGPPTITIGR